MAGERSSSVGGLIAFFAGYIGIYFSGTLVFPNLTPIINSLLSSITLYYAGLYAGFAYILFNMGLLQLYMTSLTSASGGFWNILGLLSGAGVLLLSYPLAAGKGVKSVIIGLIGLGALEIISGFPSLYSMTVVGGGLAVISAIFGIILWRAIKIEKPKAKAAKVEKPREKAVAEAVPKEVPRAKLPISQIEGIGPVYASRLEKAKIKSLSQLAKSSVDKISSVAKVNKNKATQWIRMANLLILDIIDEEAAELMVIGAGVTSLKDLAKRNADELYEEMQSALKMGKVDIPKGYRFTKKDVESWINAAQKK